MVSYAEFKALRGAIAEIPGDASNDAVGSRVAKVDELFAPESHAVALDPMTPIVVGARGSGKSFWSGVLGQTDTLEAAANAYPKLELDKIDVKFGYTGVGGEGGISSDAVDSLVPTGAHLNDAKAFWWGTIIHAINKNKNIKKTLTTCVALGKNWEKREELIQRYENELLKKERALLIVYDAVDTVARTWDRRRLLTEALFEVIWSMRAYRNIKIKLFIRPDQIDDDSLRFVELPKLRAGAVRLNWNSTDLYGLLFSRLALNPSPEVVRAFKKILKSCGLAFFEADAILTRRWSLVRDESDQKTLMSAMAGPYMGKGAHAYKKGMTYEWPLKHSADALSEVTPRSFLRLMISAAKHGDIPEDQVLSPEGIRHGLREASKTRVDQLHQEFPWIKGVLAPMAGLLLPLEEKGVFDVWRRAKTVQDLVTDADRNNYLTPFRTKDSRNEAGIFSALEEIGVMYRRKDGRLDMPDLFRVAAKLLKKGGIAPAASFG
ncbi:hypothetical protein J2T41_003147 [Pseudomonas citronellolis]|uniref:hypothetical protein n=1 Tax=Pseudomonas citronellolis TaxID=53408 RepID=UPI00209F526E|nr:hypothetical protein [Pseudomonas citronellolis]MCP1643523.1 hypothetical protein [Pseudomonas citronellolis]MCP1666449.1 hypothetical protein [Pseudomonas citronellolis]MCP1699327.1 hypothetical protein [Pseudomonas citronellolis]MCP1705858.1 hypothetical protein [Pseudomonas citronellolis]MCP1798180.1 hypothetical protein [Pseudomonas citronellolis]